MTLEELARETAARFETRTREDGSAYVATREIDPPAWVHDMIYAAHDGLLPDDGRYGLVASALEWIADNGADDDGHEFADGHVDVYTSARLEWLAASNAHAELVDEAVEELGMSETNGVADMIGLGQYLEASRVYSTVYVALADRLDELGDEAPADPRADVPKRS